MAKFNYVALDPRGKEVTGVLESDSSTSAISRIREMGYFPTNITEADKAASKKGKKGGPAAAVTGASAKAPAKRSFGSIEIKFLGGGKVKSKALTAFTRQLATLIDAGLPLLRGLDVLRKQEKNPTLKRTLQQLADSVEAGSTFSEALAQHPKIFTRLFVNMVRAGEAGGVLDVTLNRLAEFQEKAQKIKNKVISAMVYPTVVIFVAISIVTFLMIVIVPKFQEIFNDLLEGKSLPPLTLFVMAVSNMVKNQFLLVAGAVAGLVIAIKIIGKTVKGRYYLDMFKLKAPVFGQLIRKVSIARFTRTLGTLIASGVPILQALNIVRETSGNAVVAKAVSQVHDSVKEGERIVEPLEQSKVFPPMVISMVDVGEETGALPDMLMKIADVYDDEVDNAVGAITSLLEPIMIVFLAIIVGTIVIAMFLPLISVIGQLSG
ncbi:MAG TPA: type II secretion system F family protein [Verrucomicrobiae bacterium]|nr:type II secretion system F family protein [Verrucomicrobiae bacterium]